MLRPFSTRPPPTLLNATAERCQLHASPPAAMPSTAGRPCMGTCRRSSAFTSLFASPVLYPLISLLPCRFAKLTGKPVFGEDLSGVQEMLQHAVTGRSGALAIVACDAATDGRRSSDDVVGCITAQLEEIIAEDASVSGRGAPHSAPAGACSLVLLTLVVRADLRKQGVGSTLLAALRRRGRELKASGIVTDVAAANEAANSFFTASGFKKGSSSRGGSDSMIELTLPLGCSN